MLRTHTCGELRYNHVNQNVKLSGWVHHIRDKGRLIWIDLRDRFGITQLVFEEGVAPAEVWSILKTLKREYVIQVEGKAIARTSVNPELPTGDIEIQVSMIRLLNQSKLPPFLIENETDGTESLRMKYRYLDLRRKPQQDNLYLRHKCLQSIRKHLNNQDFWEIETPLLIKSTPEGARDFLVPSRLQQGFFYALPQSPQTFKQLLMIGGTDRYYQIARCFRDEDLRADRQPEFTQLDCELSFVEESDIMRIFEKLIKAVMLEVGKIELPNFQIITYATAMHHYGSDKPDLRFDMPFINLTNQLKGAGLKPFDESEIILGICLKEQAKYTRKELDELTDFVKRPQLGASGLFYIKYNKDGTIQSSISKFFSSEPLKQLAIEEKIQDGDLVLILAGRRQITYHALGALRLMLGKRHNLHKNKPWAPLWVTDFPLLEYDPDQGKHHAKHHPFTAPKDEDIDYLEKKPTHVRARAYDMVINGVELGGGSIRIHDRQVQEKMLNLLGFTITEAQERFGFLLDALEYGAPPHGGIAFGVDRLCALIGNHESIREYIAFPKNNAGRDVMLDAPTVIDAQQLVELGIKLNN